MMHRFSASQSVDLSVPDLAIPIQHYLRQPKRLVRALMDPSRVSMLEPSLFQLKMRPIKFLMLNIQPIVDLRLEVDSDGCIQLRSEGHEIKGIEQANDWFKLSLNGLLKPTLVYGQTRLQGQADLEVQVELPPMLWVTPKSLIEATGNGLLKSILMTIKQRLSHQLLTDYRHWVEAQLQDMEQGQEEFSPSSLATEQSTIG